MSLRQEIQDRIILMLSADWGGTEKETTDDILKLFEKRIDSIEYLYDMEWHCENAVDYVKNEIKEMLK